MPAPEWLEKYVWEGMARDEARYGRTPYIEARAGITIWGTLGSEAALRPDGSIWVFHEEEGRWRPASAQEAAGVVKDAVKHHPILAPLLPVNTSGKNCPTCGGTGSFTSDGHVPFPGVWCETCSGVGF